LASYGQTNGVAVGADDAPVADDAGADDCATAGVAAALELFPCALVSSAVARASAVSKVKVHAIELPILFAIGLASWKKWC
jgi:hypothetical protein